MRLHLTALFIFFLFLSNTTILNAQTSSSKDFSKNVIHGTLGTVLALNSGQLTYERLLKQSENGFFKAYYLNIKGGRNIGLDFSGNNGGTGNLLSTGVTALTGTGRNHFEIGLGLGYYIDTETEENPIDPTDNTDDSAFYLAISIGYRKQTEKGFVFRTGVGIAEWAYFGFGYSF